MGRCLAEYLCEEVKAWINIMPLFEPHAKQFEVGHICYVWCMILEWISFLCAYATQSVWLWLVPSPLQLSFHEKPGYVHETDIGKSSWCLLSRILIYCPWAIMQDIEEGACIRGRNRMGGRCHSHHAWDAKGRTPQTFWWMAIALRKVST